MFIGPMEIIGQMARTVQRATTSAHRVFEVLDTEPEILDAAKPVRLEPVRGHVRFENVSFGYDGVRQVLKGVSFDVEPGEMIGLVGPSGGGKTTVTNLIARFYDPTAGAVLIDGVDVRELETGHYRRQIGMVLQESYLFHGSVMENIRYGHPEAELEQVIAAAVAANAHDFIVGLPQGYDTIVGERGQNLSGGERQRVSIARAILHDPRILILDEATSAVDTETERKIQEAMDRLVAGRTVFAIAHRLSTLHKASRLFVMKDGRLAEIGHPRGAAVEIRQHLRKTARAADGAADRWLRGQGGWTMVRLREDLENEAGAQAGAKGGRSALGRAAGRGAGRPGASVLPVVGAWSVSVTAGRRRRGVRARRVARGAGAGVP